MHGVRGGAVRHCKHVALVACVETAYDDLSRYDDSPVEITPAEPLRPLGVRLATVRARYAEVA